MHTTAATLTMTAPTSAPLGSKSPLDRNSLTESHMPMVKFTADRLAAKLPSMVDRDDLIGAGMIGLLDAVDKFDPTRGVLFKTYAEMRVRGAMLDSLRTLDWAPRSMRRQGRAVSAAYAELEQTFNRPAREDEVAAKMGIPLAEFRRLVNDLNILSITALDQSEDDRVTVATRVAIDPAQTPLALYERSELRQSLARAIDTLPKRDREVVALYYLEELSMKEIGSVLGVTESRVSQIHSQAVLRLRTTLGHSVDKRRKRSKHN